MKHVAVDIGHGVNPDTGAVGNGYKEDTLTEEVGQLVIKKLKKRGIKVTETKPRYSSGVNHSLKQRVSTANNSGADFFVSIHFNAATESANGAEIFTMTPGSYATSVARTILNSIVDLGYRKRGVKHNGFYVIKYTTMPAILVECCFLTNKSDMSKYDPIKMANCIVNGLIGEEEETVNEKVTLRVKENTILKPSTEQSTEIKITNEDYLIDINKGLYPVILLGEEESHYLIKWDGVTDVTGFPHDNKVHYIYTGHSSIIPY